MGQRFASFRPYCLFLVLVKLFQQFRGVVGRLDAYQHADWLHVLLLAVNRRVRHTAQRHVGRALKTRRNALRQRDVQQNIACEYTNRSVLYDVIIPLVTFLVVTLVGVV